MATASPLQVEEGDVSSTEATSLLNEDQKPVPPSGNSAAWNFAILCICFGNTRAGTSVARFYGSTAYGLEVGSYSLAMFYGSYCITTLLIASPFTEYFGATETVLISQAALVGCLIFYALGTVVSEESTLQYFFVLFGSFWGGVGQGVGAPAQGVCFSAAAEVHAKETGMTVKEANDDFASYWPFFFFSWMLSYYLFAATLFEFTALSYAGFFFAMAAVGIVVTITAFFVTIGVPEVPVKKDACTQATETLIMTFTHPQVIALAPISISYGFGMMFVQDYMNDAVVSKELGSSALGYCGAIQASVVVALTTPWSRLSKMFGKATVLTISTIAYAGVLVPFFFASNEEIGKWGVVVPIYVAYGIARLSWENSGKAIFADLFLGPERAPAFSSMNFTRSFGCAMYSFFVDSSTGAGLAAAVFVPAMLMVPGQLFAYAVHKETKDAAA